MFWQQCFKEKIYAKRLSIQVRAKICTKTWSYIWCILPYIFSYFKNIFNYSTEREESGNGGLRETGRERNYISQQLFAHSNVAIHRKDTGWRQVPRSPRRCPSQTVKVQDFRPLPIAFPSVLTGSSIRREAARIWTGIPK